MIVTYHMSYWMLKHFTQVLKDNLVVAAAGQGINLLTRAWCCFELAVRMRGLGFASPPQLVATRSAEDTTSSSHTDYPSSFGSLPILTPPVPVAGRRAGIISLPISTQVVTTIGMAAEALTGGTVLVSKTDTVAVTDTVEPFTMVDPAEQLAKLLASRPPPPSGEKRSFLSIMEATVPQDLVQIRAEVLRVFRTSECFDDMLLAVVEADEVAWLASQLPIISQEGRPQI
ncbi:hypothetical protein CEUSTIGMA_g2189.t1 [Chlamydomonas eustigma]|uniref:Uncharacterized protein n=1 Tax=Chlamydomonas eustigma TaxID=1157962 RepID=A0A250WVU1_9CHLO|nr:hypothetical protein CEUSTIGMA_g2189.t1 [Chlamydomonas eustigma]|eukprot:GAX74742.1 hypothetical protein CEUSTIGMA_g2189.t1 [Chlamydomonas eustigma]